MNNIGVWRRRDDVWCGVEGGRCREGESVWRRGALVGELTMGECEEEAQQHRQPSSRDEGRVFLSTIVIIGAVSCLAHPSSPFRLW
jgi:hypothetical protein